MSTMPLFTPLLPRQRFRLIAADPAWRHAQNFGGKASHGAAQYPTMPLSDICALPVNRLAEPQAALALWVTGPHMAEGAHIEVARAWGFQLVTCAIVWIKCNPKTRPDEMLFLHATQERGGNLKSGQGHWTNGNAEFCFLGFNSSPRLPRVRKDIKQLIFAPVGRHSEKPPEYRHRLEQLFGNVSRLELFSRDRVAGWEPWGRDVPA